MNTLDRIEQEIALETLAAFESFLTGLNLTIERDERGAYHALDNRQYTATMDLIYEFRQKEGLTK